MEVLMEKIGVFYNEERYLLKFTIENPNKEFDYFANHICRIFRLSYL